MRLYFLLNPRAGSGRSSLLEERIKRRALALGARPSEIGDLGAACQLRLQAQEGTCLPEELAVFKCSAAGEARALCLKLSALYGEEALFVACGGDGTVNEIASALVGTKSGMMVLPFGSGNDFIKLLYTPAFQKNQALLEALGLGENADRVERLERTEQECFWPPLEEAQIDLLEFYDDAECRRYAVNVLAIGFDSLVGELASSLVRRFPGMSRLAYAVAIIPALFKNRRFKLHYRLTGRAWADPCRSESDRLPEQAEALVGEFDYSLAAVANASFYGGGFQPNPFANLQDGALEIGISKPLSLREIARLIGAYRRGEAQASGVLRMFSALEGELISGDEGCALHVNYDGECMRSQRLRFKLLPSALRVVLPCGSAAESLQTRARATEH